MSQPFEKVSGSEMASEFSRPSKEQGFMQAQALIEALEQFKAGHDNYPNRLDQLVPDYLLANPYSGKRRYDKFTDNTCSLAGEAKLAVYQLLFMARYSICCHFRSDIREWECFESACPALEH